MCNKILLKKVMVNIYNNIKPNNRTAKENLLYNNEVIKIIISKIKDLENYNLKHYSYILSQEIKTIKDLFIFNFYDFIIYNLYHSEAKHKPLWHFSDYYKLFGFKSKKTFYNNLKKIYKVLTDVK